ncbi:MAG: tetratricopeptide repeat protein [Bradymonadia bacterium]
MQGAPVPPGQPEGAAIGEDRRIEHQLRQLQGNVQQLEAHLQQSKRRTRLESVWVYVLFLTLVIGGAYVIVRANQSSANATIEMLTAKNKVLRESNLTLTGEVEAWRNVETSLLEFDELIRNGQKELAVERFTQLKHLRFSGLLLHLVDRFKKEVAQQKFADGKEHFDKGSFRRADDAFQLSLRYEQQPSYLGSLLYYRGMSAIRLKQFKNAAVLLEQALNEGLYKKMRLEARFYRAYAYDRSGRRRMAREHYRLFQQQHPKSHLARQAKARYKALK